MCGKTPCAHTARRITISRRISLDLRHQYYDTRLRPGGTRTLRYDLKRVAGATALSGRIEVSPDAAYVRFFKAYLAAYTLTPKERALILRALARDEASSYVLWQETKALP